MFRLFSDRQGPKCPIDPEFRIWMENAFLWLATQFGRDNIASKPILLPTLEHFPIRYDGSYDSLKVTAEIIARQMEINFNEVTLETYSHNIQEIRGDFGF